MGAETLALFDRGWWAGRMMERVMRDPSLKVPLFRFVDVLPALNDRRQIARHVKEYFADGTSPLPWFVNFLPATYLVKKGVTRFSRTFIAGETPRSTRVRSRRSRACTFR
jgi:RHH-type transcriptional regulator, proline utilization regulon repressor / proline dehydrogenase / delta 1-pyrroline-5-carboxylate dehydrogenase